MAWFDIAAGLAQGAQQGIDRVQADQVRRKADAFKDAQEKRALAAEARVAQQARNEQLDAELARQDPDNIDPAVVSQMTPEEMRSRIRQVKGPDGKPIAQLRESPGAALERKNKALVAGDFGAAFDEQKLARADVATQRGNVAGAKKKLDDPEWMRTAPDSQIRAVWRAAGYKPEDVDQFLTNEGRQRSREMMPAYIQATISAAASERAAKYASDRNYSDNMTRLDIAKSNRQGRDDAATAGRKLQISKMLVDQDETLLDKPAELKKRVDLMHDMLMRQLGNPGSGDGGSLPDDTFSLVPNPDDQ